MCRCGGACTGTCGGTPKSGYLQQWLWVSVTAAVSSCYSPSVGGGIGGVAPKCSEAKVGGGEEERGRGYRIVDSGSAGGSGACSLDGMALKGLLRAKERRSRHVGVGARNREPQSVVAVTCTKEQNHKNRTTEQRKKQTEHLKKNNQQIIRIPEKEKKRKI
jgi:hypothetical protein